MSFCQFYIIHNLEKRRKSNILRLLSESNISNNNVSFINHPNKNEITYEIKKNPKTQFLIDSKINNEIKIKYKHFYKELDQIIAS